MKHGIVYAEPGIYAGWPANHGAWQWDDEFLFGFMRGKNKSAGMHDIVEPYEKVLARSTNGGKSWRIEVPNVDFEGSYPTPAPSFDMQNSIMRVCGIYDHGGEYCHEAGAFYLSKDRGKEWTGPFAFTGLKTFSGLSSIICTARTAVMPQRHLAFLSKGNSTIWGTDSTFCVRHVDNHRFEFVSTVCEDSARAVMPACTEINDRIVVTLRRRKTGHRNCWIDAFGSDDGAKTWQFLSFVGSTGGHNGNPPALITLTDGRLLCVFGNRDEGSLVYALSDDRGGTWHTELLRTNDVENVDIGYPRLFMRSDGVPVCVYYWIDAHRRQHIASTALGL